MAGRGLPAISCPAERNTERTVAGRHRAVVELVRSGVATLPWNQWQLSNGMGGNFAVESMATFAWNTHLGARRAASFDVWPEISETKALWGRDSRRGSCGDRVDKGRFRATGGVAAAATGSGIGRWRGRSGHGTAASRSAWWGTSGQR